MKNDVEYWKNFREGQTDPLHTHNDQKYYLDYGRELSLLLHPAPSTILELGCGSGSLYKPLGFDKADTYVGVDLSDSMLKEFNTSHTGTILHQGSADTYKDSNTYDLIFTNGVIQYLSIDMLRNQIQNALEMLAENGAIIHSSIPWDKMRKQYMKGSLTPPYLGNGIKASLLYFVISLGLKKDKMGRWYSINDFKAIANEFNLTAKFYGSMYYPYRFHVVLKRS